jgi:hypothetical protein
MSQSSREIYWSAILADFRRSGLTHVQFCRLRRISLPSFRTWLYRLRPGLPPRRARSTRCANSPTHVPAQTETPTFLPVHVRPRPLEATRDHQALRPPAPLELVLGDQCHLRVPTGFDPATLHQLLDVLEQRS